MLKKTKKTILTLTLTAFAMYVLSVTASTLIAIAVTR